jgi:hypothetical protein
MDACDGAAAAAAATGHARRPRRAQPSRMQRRQPRLAACDRRCVTLSSDAIQEKIDPAVRAAVVWR